MTTLALTWVNSHFCQAATCFRIGSKFRCILGNFNRNEVDERERVYYTNFDFPEAGVPGEFVMLRAWRHLDLRGWKQVVRDAAVSCGYRTLARGWFPTKPDGFGDPGPQHPGR